MSSGNQGVFDVIIIGAGLYGLYAAQRCGRMGKKVLVLEYDNEAFSRATYINQARVHMGYHYPRSYSTGIKSAGYFERFSRDYADCIHGDFTKIYATSRCFSWTNGDQFRKFCRDADIPCSDVNPGEYFRPDMCDGAFLTKEYTFDAQLLKDQLLEELARCPKAEVRYGVRITDMTQHSDHFTLQMAGGETFHTDFLLNATYASVNQILDRLGYELFTIKYELCEMILCTVDQRLKPLGITVMDGPFFSIMPFGKTPYHSLTSVTFTPHVASHEPLPRFDCQEKSGGYCSPVQLGNCNDCPAKPDSAWPYMSQLARKYLRDELEFQYAGSLFSLKPILKASEIDDSRPTVIRQFSRTPVFISVLSGKINTVYDMDEVLNNGGL